MHRRKSAKELFPKNRKKSKKKHFDEKRIEGKSGLLGTMNNSHTLVFYALFS
jgi:hypothetical protein